MSALSRVMLELSQHQSRCKTHNSKGVDSLPVHSERNGLRFLLLLVFFYVAAEREGTRHAVSALCPVHTHTHTHSGHFSL